METKSNKVTGLTLTRRSVAKSAMAPRSATFHCTDTFTKPFTFCKFPGNSGWPLRTSAMLLWQPCLAVLVSGEKLLCSVHFPTACTRTVDSSEGVFFRSSFHFSERGQYLWEMLPQKAWQIGGNEYNLRLRQLRWPSKAPSIMQGHTRHQPMHSWHMWHKARPTGKPSPSGTTHGDR